MRMERELIKFYKKQAFNVAMIMLFFIGVFLWLEFSVSNIKRNSKMVIGRVAEVYYAGAGRPYIEYEYVVNKKEYTSKRSITEESVIKSINQQILVIYDSTNISISAAILDIDISSFTQKQLDSLFKKRIESLNSWNWN